MALNSGQTGQVLHVFSCPQIAHDSWLSASADSDEDYSLQWLHPSTSDNHSGPKVIKLFNWNTMNLEKVKSNSILRKLATSQLRGKQLKKIISVKSQNFSGMLFSFLFAILSILQAGWDVVSRYLLKGLYNLKSSALLAFLSPSPGCNIVKSPAFSAHTYSMLLHGVLIRLLISFDILTH